MISYPKVEKMYDYFCTCESPDIYSPQLISAFAGWFAKDPAVLRQVGHVLLQLPYMEVRQPRRVLIADDCFKMSLLPQDQILGSVLKAIHKLLGRRLLPPTVSLFQPM